MKLSLCRLPCAVVLLSLLAPAVVQAQRDPGGPDQVVSPAVPTRDPGGPSQGENAADFLRRADLALLPELRLGGQDARWGRRMQLHAGLGQRGPNGRCVFKLEFEVVNSGLVSSGATRHSLRLAPPGPLTAMPPAAHAAVWEVEQPTLAAGARQRFRSQVELAPGRVWLQVSLDSAERVPERVEDNNQRRVRIDLVGPC
jgi:hypothetical protein